MSLTSKLIAKLLVLCGVSLTCTACYGVPEPRYRTKIEGVVSDEATGEPIEGIKISSDGYRSEGDLSDMDGKFDFLRYMSSPQKIRVVVEDIDGPENGGEYAAQSREVELTQINFAPTDGRGGRNATWEGNWKIEFALKLKSQENE